MIYAKDIQGRKTISNTADWQASGGKRMEDVLGKTDFDTYPAELAARFWADDKMVLDLGKPIINREEPGRDLQGNPIWTLTTKVPLRDDKGQVVGLVGVGRDITERKRVEFELNNRKQYFEFLVQNILSQSLCSITTNASSPAIPPLRNYMATKSLRSSALCSTLSLPPKRHLSEARQYSQQVMTANIHAVGKRRRRDGSLVDVEIFGVPVVVGGEKTACR